MAWYPVGTPRYEFRGGELARVQMLYNDETGETQEDAQPADEAGYGGDAAGASGAFGPQITGDVPSDTTGAPRGSINLPGPFIPGESAAADKAFASGTFGGAVNEAMKSYGRPSQGDAAGYGGNFGGQVAGQGGPMSQQGNSLTPQQQEQFGTPQLPPGTAPNSQVDANGRPIADFMRGQIMYDPTNPVTAMENVIQDMGLGRGFGNPFVQFAKSMAQGLATAYMAKNALNQGVTGESMANAPYAFKDYLTNALGGGAGAGMGAARGMGQGMQEMINTAGQLPQLVQAIRDLNQSNAQGAGGVNPFLELMARGLSANLGEGTTGFLANLLGPAMPRELAQGYGAGLSARLRNSQRAIMGIGPGGQSEGQPLGEGDIWTYLLGAK